MKFSGKINPEHDGFYERGKRIAMLEAKLKEMEHADDTTTKMAHKVIVDLKAKLKDAKLETCSYVGTCSGVEGGRNKAQRRIKDLEAKLKEQKEHYESLLNARYDPDGWVQKNDDMRAKLAAAEKDITDQSYTISHKNDRIAELEASLAAAEAQLALQGMSNESTARQLKDAKLHHVQHHEEWRKQNKLIAGLKADIEMWKRAAVGHQENAKWPDKRNQELKAELGAADICDKANKEHIAKLLACCKECNGPIIPIPKKPLTKRGP